MKRLTARAANLKTSAVNQMGHAYIQVDDIDEAMEKLSSYEDTGLEPEEIMDGMLLTGWIPVSERLPEKGDYTCYLCTLDGELCGQKEPFTGMCGFENGEWDEPEFVIAWMPMPEPYKA